MYKFKVGQFVQIKNVPVRFRRWQDQIVVIVKNNKWDDEEPYSVIGLGDECFYVSEKQIEAVNPKSLWCVMWTDRYDSLSVYFKTRKDANAFAKKMEGKRGILQVNIFRHAQHIK